MAAIATTTISRGDYGEYVVKAFDRDGRRMPNADYFTDDLDDARNTSAAMLGEDKPRTGQSAIDQNTGLPIESGLPVIEVALAPFEATDVWDWVADAAGPYWSLGEGDDRLIIDAVTLADDKHVGRIVNDSEVIADFIDRLGTLVELCREGITELGFVRTRNTTRERMELVQTCKAVPHVEAKLRAAVAEVN